MNVNVSTNAQELNDALSSNYMLVSMTIRIWSGKRTDRSATDELIEQKHAAKDSGAFVKKLLASADTELRDVQAAAAALRAFLYSHTLPWTLTADGAKRGERLVATSKAMEFLRDVAALKRQYDEAVVKLQSVWDDRVAQAKTNLGALASDSDYPLSHELLNLFSVTVDVKPMPAVQDFSRMNVPAALQSALAQRMAQHTEQQMKNAMDDLRGRLLDELSRIATQLSKVGAGEKTKLYETLITNTRSLIELARSMNLSGSQKLSDLADKIEAKLLAHPVEVYRNDKARAAVVAHDAKLILDEASQPDVWY
jgi:hypothetical protein